MKKKKTTCINEQTINNLPQYMPGQCVLDCIPELADAGTENERMVLTCHAVGVFDVVPYIGMNPPQGYSYIWSSNEWDAASGRFIWIPDSEFYEYDGPIVVGEERPMLPKVFKIRNWVDEHKLYAQTILDNILTTTPGETSVSVTTDENTPYANIIIECGKRDNLTVDGMTMPEIFGTTQQQLDDFQNTYRVWVHPEFIVLPYAKTEPEAYYSVDGNMYSSFTELQAYFESQSGDVGDKDK